MQSETAPPVVCNIPHFFLNKSALHRRLSRQGVFLFMQVGGCITKYAKSHIYGLTCSFKNILKSHIFTFIWDYSVDSLSSCTTKELKSSLISF